MALIDLEDLRRLDPKMRLDRVMRSLRSARVAAVAVLGNVHSAETVRSAHESQLALFELPDSISLTQVERAVIRLIVDRAGYLAQRSAELQRELSQAALNGGGLDNIAARLHRFALQPVVLLGDDARVLATGGLDDLSADGQRPLADLLPNLTMLRSWLATLALSLFCRLARHGEPGVVCADRHTG